MHNILGLIALYSELSYIASDTFNNYTVEWLTFDFFVKCIKRLELDKLVECDKMVNTYAIYIFINCV